MEPLVPNHYIRLLWRSNTEHLNPASIWMTLSIRLRWVRSIYLGISSLISEPWPSWPR